MYRGSMLPARASGVPANASLPNDNQSMQVCVQVNFHLFDNIWRATTHLEIWQFKNAVLRHEQSSVPGRGASPAKKHKA